jgi:hypothetical protein
VNARMLGRLAVMTLVAAAGVACNSDRANVLAPIGAPSWDFKLSSVGINLPRGTIAVAAPVGFKGTLTVNMQGLQALSAGTYRLWLADSAMTTVVKARGNIKVIETDTAFNAQGDPIVTIDSSVAFAGATSFAAGGPRQRVRVIIDSTTMVGAADPLLAGRVFFITAEADTSAATPASTSPRPLGAFHPLTAGSTNLSFGYFSTDAVQKYVYISAGLGTGGVRDNIMILDDSTTMRPPLGYYLASYLLWSDSTGARDTIPLGPQTAPYPRRNVSLLNADVDATIDPTVLASPPRIIAAANRIDADTVAKLTGHNAGATGLAKDYRGVSSVRIVLQNKLADPNAMSPTVIINGDMPDLVKKGP